MCPGLTGQTALDVLVPEDAHVLDDERLRLDRGLEALLPMPRHVSRHRDGEQDDSDTEHAPSPDSLDGDPRALSDENEVLAKGAADQLLGANAVRPPSSSPPSRARSRRACSSRSRSGARSASMPRSGRCPGRP